MVRSKQPKGNAPTSGDDGLDHDNTSDANAPAKTTKAKKGAAAATKPEAVVKETRRGNKPVAETLGASKQTLPKQEAEPTETKRGIKSEESKPLETRRGATKHGAQGGSPDAPPGASVAVKHEAEPEGAASKGTRNKQPNIDDPPALSQAVVKKEPGAGAEQQPPVALPRRPPSPRLQAQRGRSAVEALRSAAHSARLASEAMMTASRAITDAMQRLALQEELPEDEPIPGRDYIRPF